ncbi:MAG: aconitase X swivel domain-containing protein [Longimicrobiales bacterium]
MDVTAGTALVLEGRALVAGEAAGELLVASEPLSFWGGYNADTGEIIDRRHVLSGLNASGRILAIPSTRGSSTTSAVLLEAIRAGKAPAAILTSEVDVFLALASIVADEMYRTPLPVVALRSDDFRRLRSGVRATVERSGRVRLGGGPI